MIFRIASWFIRMRWILLFLIFFAGMNSAYINVTACGNLLGNDEYRMNTSISTASDCFTVLGDNILFDCQGYNIDGDDTWLDTAIYIDGHSNVTIQNCNITDFSYAVLTSNNANDDHIENCTFSSQASYAIFFTGVGAGNLTVNGTTVFDSIEGVRIQGGASDVNVTYSTFYSNQNGITASASNCYFAYNNLSLNGDYGIQGSGLSSSLIEYNNINENGVTADSGIYLGTSSSSNVIQHNIINGNYGKGITIEITSNTNNITNNTIYDSVLSGMYIASTGNRIETNDINNSGLYGIHLTGAASSVLLNNNISYSASNALYLSNADNSVINSTYGVFSGLEGIKMLATSTGNVLGDNIFCYNEGTYDYNDLDSNTESNTTCDSSNPGSLCDNECYYPCINLSDSGTWFGRLTYVGGEFYVNDNIDLCEQNYSTGDELLIVNSSDIYINCNNSVFTGDFGNIGVWTSNFDNITVYNCTFQEFLTGIYKTNGEDDNYYNNTFYNDTNGVYLSTGADFNLVHSNIFDYADSIRMSTADSNLIYNNTISNGINYGIYFSSSATNNTVFWNDIQDSVQGLSFASEGNTAYNNTVGGGTYAAWFSSANNNLYNNTLQNSTYYDIRAVPTSCNIGTIEGNIGTGNLPLVYVTNYSGYLIDYDVSAIILCNVTGLVSGITVGGFGNNGIQVFNTDGLSISNIVSSGNYNGLYGYLTANLTVGNSEFNDNAYRGIENVGGFLNVYDNVEANNNTYDGFYASSDYNLTVKNSEFSYNGIAGMNLEAIDSLIYNNDINFNNYYGVLLDSTDTSNFTSNTVLNTTMVGWYVDFSDDNVFLNNLVNYSGDSGMHVTAFSSGNTLTSTMACYNNLNTNITEYDFIDGDASVESDSTCDTDNPNDICDNRCLKLIPELNLTAAPGWTNAQGIQTTITCAANHSEAAEVLRRNGTIVGNPDVQTLLSGLYNYTCTIAETENYTSASVTGWLSVTPLPFLELTPEYPSHMENLNCTFSTIGSGASTLYWLVNGTVNSSEVVTGLASSRFISWHDTRKHDNWTCLISSVGGNRSAYVIIGDVMDFSDANGDFFDEQTESFLGGGVLELFIGIFALGITVLLSKNIVTVALIYGIVCLALFFIFGNPIFFGICALSFLLGVFLKSVGGGESK